ncbi:hypothetical protein [Terrimonas alba]|uniref:hypothetical protein n=1 Tax=Terrimonas alba TaxID=3349636 RepID=UPI0035F23508
MKCPWITVCVYLLFTVCAQAQSAKPRAGIVPHHVKVQYAGSIGFISAGAGYEFGKKKKLQGDLFYGYVPESVGGVNIHSITAKLTWLPVSKSLKNDLKLDLLTAGILVNYSFGRRYHLFSRTKYSFVYYGFPTAAHTAVFVGGAITKNKFGVYYEFGTTDRDLVSFASNPKAIGFFEIINIGIGARISLR